MQLRDEITKYKVGAPARVGLVAPNDVTVPGGNTGLDPSQTSFFQVRPIFCFASYQTICGLLLMPVVAQGLQVRFCCTLFT